MLIEAFGGDGGEAEKEEGGVIEGLMGRDGEVVLPAGGMGLGAGGDRAEVGHEAEDALGLLSFERDGIAVGIQFDGLIRFGPVAISGSFCGGVLV